MSKNIAGKIKINSFADIVGGDEPSVTEILLTQLHDFNNHPFKVLDDEKMDETVNSIKEHGVLIPGVVRPLMTGGYEIISGHRRKRACEIAGFETMPAIIKNYSDDEAVIAMVDSNIYREDILPSEKARAYKMKYEAEKHQGKETEKNGKTIELMASASGESSKTIQRYIWLSRLSDILLQMVDDKKLSFVCGVDLSFLKEKEQKWVEDVIEELSDTDGFRISPAQSLKIKEYSNQNELSKALVKEILSVEKQIQKKISFKREKLSQYFEETTSDEEIENTIIELLEKWKREKGDF